MKKISLFLVLVGLVLASSVDELPSVIAFDATIYPGGGADCSAEFMQHGSIRFFADELQGEKNYELKLIGGWENEMGSYHVPVFFNDIVGEEIVELEKYPVFMRLPYDGNVQTIQLVDESGNILCEVTKSYNAPYVGIQDPQTGGSWSSVDFVQWEASDWDDDELTFDIYYENNEGTGWILAAADIEGDSYTFLQSLEATKIRVVAKDGFNTAEAVSESSHSTGNVNENIELESDTNIVGEDKDIEPHDFSFIEDVIVYEDIEPEKGWCLSGIFFVGLILLGLARSNN